MVSSRSASVMVRVSNTFELKATVQSLLRIRDSVRGGGTGRRRAEAKGDGSVNESPTHRVPATGAHRHFTPARRPSPTQSCRRRSRLSVQSARRGREIGRRTQVQLHRGRSGVGRPHARQLALDASGATPWPGPNDASPRATSPNRPSRPCRAWSASPTTMAVNASMRCAPRPSTSTASRRGSSVNGSRTAAGWTDRAANPTRPSPAIQTSVAGTTHTLAAGWPMASPVFNQGRYNTANREREAPPRPVRAGRNRGQITQKSRSSVPGIAVKYAGIRIDGFSAKRGGRRSGAERT